MAGNSVTLEFAGDAAKLQRAARQASDSVTEFGTSATRSGDQASDSAAGASRLESRLGSLGAATSGATDAIGAFGDGVQAVADIQDFARAKAARLAQAEQDVEQAMADGRQATIDLRQARVDLRQANQDVAQSGLDLKQAEIDQQQAALDAATAQKEYNKAVREHGKDSDEAKQASIDLKQANQDLAQADADAKQASIDLKQATTDKAQAVEDATQANLDGKQAQLDLNDAMHEANPPDLQEWADMIGLVTPLLSAVVGVLGLVTAAQWLFNASLWASPITWIVIGVIALIAVIVLIATKTTWFQDAWNAAWGGIKAAASAVGSWFKDVLWGQWIKGAWEGIINGGKKAWEWIRDLPKKIGNAFANVGDMISRPFKAAFNFIADAWNSTIGSLSWTFPGAFGVGAFTIDVPNIPRFHTGGKVPGIPGTEVPIMALAGETIRPAGFGGGDGVHVTVYLDSDVLIDAVADGVTRRGGRGPGNVQMVLGGGR